MSKLWLRMWGLESFSHCHSKASNPMGLRLFPLLCELFKAKWPEPHLSTPPFVTFVTPILQVSCRILSICPAIRLWIAIIHSEICFAQSPEICVRKAFFAPANGRVMTKMMTKIWPTNIVKTRTAQGFQRFPKGKKDFLSLKFCAHGVFGQRKGLVSMECYHKSRVGKLTKVW